MLRRSLQVLSLLVEQALAGLKHLLGLNRGRKIVLGQGIAPQIGELRSILLFGYMGMGDAVMFEPTLRAFLRRYPHAEFDVIVGSTSQSLAILNQVFAEERRQFRKVYEFDFKYAASKDRKNVIRELIRSGYDACIAVYTTPLPYFISVLESIPIRIGHTIRAQQWYKPRANFLLNLGRPVYQEVDEREPHRHFRLAQAVGIQTQGELPIPKITVLDSDRQWASQFLKKDGLDSKELVAVHLGVSKAMSWKKWSDQRYAEVLRHIDSSNVHFLFFGSANEVDEIEVARSYVKDRSTVFAGDLNVMQVAALIERCNLTIGNDSGIGHLSIAIGTRTFRIFGPSDHFGCEPYNEGHVTYYKSLSCSPCMNLGLIKPGYNVLNCGHRNCLGLITVEEITKSVLTLLDHK